METESVCSSDTTSHEEDTTGHEEDVLTRDGLLPLPAIYEHYKHNLVRKIIRY